MNRRSWRALLWSLVCPGVGEWRLGYRALGLVFTLVFAVLCVWLLVSAYSLVYGLAELVKLRDPSLAAPVTSAGDAAATGLRLFVAIHREYMTQRAALHDKLWYPIWAIAVVYLWSMAQAWMLGAVAERAERATSPRPRAEGARSAPAAKADRETTKDATAG